MVTADLRYCPECGGVMVYDRNSKLYTCSSCGISMNMQQIIEYQEKLRSEKERVEREKRKKEEYLEWWLSSKK
ncbi:MAG: hypothetical protein QXI52_05520 [Nitrososphaerota archaeon]